MDQRGAMSGCPEPLEKIFRQVEEESERRAEAEEQLNRVEALDKLASESTVKKAKARRRGSISISRLGQFTFDEALAKGTQGPISPTSPFYQSHVANASTSSVASGASAFSNDNAHKEDLNQVIQIMQIPSKIGSIARMIPRRLSRAQTHSVIPQSDGGIIGIGVSVEETTEHSSITSIDDGSEASRAPSRRASVHAAHSLRHQSSMSTINGAPATGSRQSWMSKARVFTQKFRRKPSVAEPTFKNSS